MEDPEGVTTGGFSKKLHMASSGLFLDMARSSFNMALRLTLSRILIRSPQQFLPYPNSSEYHRTDSFLPLRIDTIQE